MPSLLDALMDEAEELAMNRILYDPSDEQILNALREITNVQFSSKSTCAKVALAAYRRMSEARCNVDMIWTR